MELTVILQSMLLDWRRKTEWTEETPKARGELYMHGEESGTKHLILEG